VTCFVERQIQRIQCILWKPKCLPYVLYTVLWLVRRMTHRDGRRCFRGKRSLTSQPSVRSCCASEDDACSCGQRPQGHVQMNINPLAMIAIPRYCWRDELRAIRACKPWNDPSKLGAMRKSEPWRTRVCQGERLPNWYLCIQATSAPRRFPILLLANRWRPVQYDVVPRKSAYREAVPRLTESTTKDISHHGIKYKSASPS
jgi:hypothetical protein